MRFKGVYCATCAIERSKTAAVGDQFELEIKNTDFRDDLTMDFTCARDHQSTLVIERSKFEVLFHFGAMALLDGYTREAVSSFAAAVERLYEYAIEVMLFRSVADEVAFKAAWNVVKNQSERQVGAFCFLFLQAFGKAPLVLDDKAVNFRNKAIHKGYIPTADEAKNYGAKLFEHIFSVVAVLRASMASDMRSVLQRWRSAQGEEIMRKGRQVVHLPINTVFRAQPWEGGFGQEGFESELARLSEYRQFTS